MGNKINITVNHITRVEGHGNIKIDIQAGVIKECRLEIVEAPRFFEAMVKGRDFTEAALITSRICGICSVGHQLASLAATEDAFNIKISPQEKLLRRLINCGEYFESHILHIYFLAVPDFVGVKSVIPLIHTHKEVVLQALQLKRLGHFIGDTIGGRLVHPIALAPQAMTMVPPAAQLETIISKLKEGKRELQRAIKTLKAVTLPQFVRATEYISLYKEGEYALLEGDIYSSDTGISSYKDYRAITNEYLVSHATAKQAKHQRAAFMVGALARFNNNYRWLSPSAKEVAAELGLQPPCYNSYMITMAQFVELFHIADDAIVAAEELLNLKLEVEQPSFTIQAGTGIGAVEVPRGTLYHEYSYDAQGIITNANCVIPTGQNLGNIERDLQTLLPTVLAHTREEITLFLEMLVRAYDPCISCSTHILTVEFI